MAVGLGGLYLLVRVRSEVHGDEAQPEEGATASEPADHSAAVSGPDYPFPHAKPPPECVKDEQIWERAKQRVRPYWHEYREPWAVVTHVYEQMGGRAA